MATNFEFYKDEIIQISKGAFGVALKNGKPCSCQATSCKECEFHKHNQDVTCAAPRFEWFYAEHIEQPKLTKRERAFCEAVQTGYIARDADGGLCWIHKDSVFKKEAGYWKSALCAKLDYMDLGFNFVKWTDEKRWAVEDLLKLDVIDENPTSSNKDSNEVQHETD